MREIKFRGRFGGSWYFFDLPHWDFVEPDTLGQYTGLKDCEGHEIYEGDIVERDNSYFQKTCPTLPKTTVGAVEWCDGEFIVKGSYKLFSSSDKFPIRVIGNVHDNPDLLEVEHD